MSGLNARLEALRGRVGEGVNSRAIAAGGAGAVVLALLLLALWGEAPSGAMIQMPRGSPGWNSMSWRSPIGRRRPRSIRAP